MAIKILHIISGLNDGGAESLLFSFLCHTDNNINYVIHIQRITKNICGEPKLNHGNLSDISPIDIIKGNNELKQKLTGCEIKEWPNDKKQYVEINVRKTPTTVS